MTALFFAALTALNVYLAIKSQTIVGDFNMFFAGMCFMIVVRELIGWIRENRSADY